MFLRVFAAAFMAVIVLQWTAIGPKLSLPNYRGCDARGYDDDHYLAFCDNSYGAYDSAGIYLDLESVQKSIRAADVVILGNSRAVFGFSTEATESFFARRAIRYYMLAFQHDEQYRFPLAILKMTGARPKAVIINADPFFDEKLSRPAREAMGPNGSAHARYRQFLQTLHRALCEWERVPSAWRTGYCEGGVMTVFRSRQNGRWTSFGVPSGRYPVTPPGDGTVPPDERHVTAANGLRKALGLRAECVILTAVPATNMNLAGLEALGRKTEMRAAATYLDGLTTFDRSHLDQESAERWSARVLSDIRPLLDGCLARTNISKRDPG